MKGRGQQAGALQLKQLRKYWRQEEKKIQGTPQGRRECEASNSDKDFISKYKKF